MIGRGLDVNKETSLNGMLLQSNTSFVILKNTEISDYIDYRHYTDKKGIEHRENLFNHFLKSV